MARTKKFFKIKLPFLKLKINQRSFFTILGFLLIGFSLLLLLSYLQQGSILITINAKLADGFGTVSLFVPILLLLLGTHFFNSKKLKIIRPHITLGLLLLFIGVLGLTHSGSYGNVVFDNLKQDFSLFGALIILFTTIVVGGIVFLNTSIDAFLVFIAGIVKSFIEGLKKQSDLFSKRQSKSESDNEYIQDKRRPVTVPTHALPNSQGELTIRPLSKTQSQWVFPPLSLLSDIEQTEADRGDVKKNSEIIERTLDSFGIRARVVEVNKGPTVTQYALEIVMGTKLSKITALSNDLALAIAASTGQVRIEAPIPGRSLVGIEIPNKKGEIVALKRMLGEDIMTKSNNPLLVPLGLDVSGTPQVVDIGRMPHVLIAGTTGAGKSVILNAWICSFLFRTKPSDLRLILVDPKRVELGLYNGIPHLMTEVIVDPEKIISALKWTVGEMENRYKQFAKMSARNIEGYNQITGVEKYPYIIFIIDELADLMMFSARDAEELITRIAQMARATGIHLILATQRPSVDVITGLMKANIPSRIAFNVASMIDSRVVLDTPGAEKLLGKGDMLFLPPDQAKPRRIQSPFLSEKDAAAVVTFIKQNVPAVHYTEEVVNQDVALKGSGGRTVGSGNENHDALFNQAIDVISSFGKASSSLLQRKLSIGYARAAKLLDQLEEEGFVSGAEGSKPREVLRRQSAIDDGAEPEAMGDI
ncbi:hypothetical protein A3D80_03270 [Candidatus Roizmanbacteria bacterium RIFCSPHIGHO2_02_FULL_40_13b]|uniref:FtsK domain-containing protein n=1 Tax=Candidatus Roizmanbacteria bacterium RIFCSPHIGHO2_01_FULL_39_24 TaxID=1802032 RepID=A0A1F7GL32_9BACT|nr:MAG: hypothetical protein A2799_01015 [Candidatus Roizmanbacteria bacterium RIFCSPHIGHO2_01_FULL_39_24]OGK27072.1 MAG: hypothetical protein A3D80_03270 [Candidatus Roizmanbacteria bacterium RIFCSPHIGHO2_02_FULL_40_13b]OGK48919.1 MAG: hypothetical protein A3A56_01455 [Candidatus Roizmanbacteria bacterium RIFCSPLOWO2_01_FULL_40_32]OGK57177.1 MAG: hypothetical protein A3H83_00720 [Candidatus Roizmanbacteria bacterium RIFCSPLOWO2_02_FULL_39_8]